MTNFALVDFSNINPRAESEADVRDSFERIQDICFEVSQQCSINQLNVEDIPEFDVLLYDGWINKSGAKTPKTLLVGKLLDELRGTSRGIRIRPTLVTTLRFLPQTILNGTYRRDNNGKPSQKMVDQMLVHDLHQIVIEEDDCNAIVISNDEDFVPGLVFASVDRECVYWVTSRDSVCNDLLLGSTKLKILRVQEWRNN